MNFDDLLLQADYDVQKDIVGLAIYFLDRIRGLDPVESTQIRELIEDSRAAVTLSSIYSYYHRLERDGMLVQLNSGEYRLTPEGLEKYSSMAELGEFEGELRSEPFIGDIETDDEFYESLVMDINRAYEVGLDDAVLILSRKLLENIVLDLLRARYGLSDEKKELFYDTENGRLLGFSRLLDNMRENFDDGFSYWSDRFNEDTIDEIESLKGRGDATAHSIEVDVSEAEIEGFKERVNPVVEVLFYVLEQIRSSSGS